MRKWLIRVGGAVVVLGLSCAGLGTWAVADRTLAGSGPESVGTRTWVVGKGGRRVPITAWFPALGAEGIDIVDGAPAVTEAPFVVFSHGAMGNVWSNRSLYRELASHGYVVVVPDHPDVAMPATYPDGDQVWASAAFREALALGSPDEVAASGALQPFVAAMVTDDRGGLASAPTATNIRPTARIWSGHSLGSAAALDGCKADPACDAVVSLDGPPYGRIDGPVGDLSLRDPGQDAPLLAITATEMLAVPGAKPVYDMLQAEISASRGGAIRLVLQDSGHLDVTDVPLLIRPGLARPILGWSQLAPGDAEARIRAVNTAVRTWLDATVRDLGTFDPSVHGPELSVQTVVPARP